VAVVAAVVRVKVVPLDEEAGLNAAVTPVGNPEAEKLTELLKPFTPVTPMASLTELPGATLTLPALGDNVKEAPAVITRFTVVDAVALPDVPVMVSVYLPTAVLIDGKTTSVVPVNPPDEPLGSPDTDRLTEPVKPLAGITLMTSVPPTFCGSVRVAEDGVRLNAVDAPVTVNLTLVVAVRLPDVPVMVIA
jgi:hypothetical protein